MITKNHPSAYAELFAKAQNALKTYGSNDTFKNATISNIDDYFACLAELARIEDENPELVDPIFTILPATESTFNIDADKRSISIPENFARYGVGVQGDEIAEILYFSIDRYFDAMDLAEMDIIVQWKHSEDKDNVSNLSATYKKSLTLQPGKIVFGWPISAEVTERSGNIQFSIRFYRRDDVTKELIYSFSTLTSVIKIQAGLDFELDEDSTKAAINMSQQIYNNLRNSKKAVVGYKIAVPVFENYYVQVENELVDANQTLTYDLPCTFVAKAGIPINTPADEHVSGAGLAYSWYKQGESAELIGSTIYKEDPKTQYNPNEIYFIKVKEGETEYYKPYYIVGDNNPFDDETAAGEDVVLYTRHSGFNPPAAGTYYAVANNIYVPGAYAQVKSAEWTVPAPVNPGFTYGSADNTVLLDDVNGATINITANVTDGGVLTTAWYRSDSPEFSAAEPIENATSADYIATQEGYYFVEAKNTRNNTTATIVSSSVWAKYDASAPVIISHSPTTALGGEVKIEVEKPAHSDENGLSYQWQDENNQNIQGATSNTYTPNSHGIYRCAVTNTYKGRNKTVLSNWITVTPAS